MTEIRQLHINI